MINKYAPIILFVYNRLDHATMVVDALLKNPEAKDSDLIVFSDCAKDDSTVEKVNAVRSYFRELNGFDNIELVEREYNYGIEKNEYEGISQVLNQYDRAIILEDDIVVGNTFLAFMNEGLEKYENEEQVCSITGYSFLDDSDTNRSNMAAFISLTSAWGWGTWSDRWQGFQGVVYKKDLRKLYSSKCREKFDQGFYYSNMIIDQYLTDCLTWDVVWYWFNFINEKCTLVPYRTLVNNIGMDGTGVHYNNPDDNQNNIRYIDNINIDGFPNTVKLDNELMKKIKEILSEMNYVPDNGFLCCLWKIKQIIKWAIYRYKLLSAEKKHEI